MTVELYRDVLGHFCAQIMDAEGHWLPLETSRYTSRAIAMAYWAHKYPDACVYYLTHA